MPANSTEPRLATYLHNKGNKMGLPIGGTFELTARCNFDCPMCYVHLHQNDINAIGKELTTQQWIDLAQTASDAGMVFVLLTGGEPFLRKDFFEIYHAMKKMGLVISINTNGSLLEGEIRKELLKDPPFRINITLYGGCMETYQKMCGQSSFDRVVENIRALKDAGVSVRLNLSVTPYNCEDMERIYQISRELDVPIKATSYMYPPVRVDGKRFNRLSAKEAATYSVKWDALRFSSEEFSLRAKLMAEMKAAELPECSADLDEGVSCRAGRSSFWVTWNGTMVPCGMLTQPSASLENGFQAAWDHIRNETRKIRTPGVCGVCPKRELCGVCAAVCYTETGTFDRVPEYMCQMTGEIIKETCKAYEERSKSQNGV